MDKLNGQFSSLALSSKSSCFLLEMPKNACSFSINCLLKERYCFCKGSTHMEFNTYLIIQFCPSLINWVSLCNWCFQVQVLQEITLSCEIWINRVGFVLIRSSIWSFAVPQVKSISNLSWNGHRRSNRSSCWIYQIVWNLTMIPWFRYIYIVQNYMVC